MILSKNSELGEFETIREPAHIERVWTEIGAALPGYWQAFVKRQPSAKLAARFGADEKTPAEAAVAMQTFAAAVQSYEKAAAKYRDFFDPDAMEEFADDPNAFKSHLAKEVPVIAGTLTQRRPELQEWQRDFRMARGKDLLAVFSNVLDFSQEWAAQQPDTTYASLDIADDFGLDPLDADETMTLSKVIGMGIKSIVLHHLDPRVFPQRARNDLYGLYFLSGMKDFGLASGSSEFLMINDREPAPNGSLIMEHNFWYPYGLYSLYAIRIFRWLDGRTRELGGGLDAKLRYVFVSCFLSAVCAEHSEHMKIMRVHDRFGVPA